ncbi:hypothetical protein [Parasedimentitalea psychrophila]|uniref:Uncharacterized protein n=1 Tax=Parasedimentitalea psychrophila TaxID=2997337 RepID=A0A9Y2KY34_9RHOB|nr:hypothetical protein [Parasedimentitalea psychrophila]WIY23872.1 hypothetical protein QPJ95_14630 [Parasedimentitalea psychrophila]
MNSIHFSQQVPVPTFGRTTPDDAAKPLVDAEEYGSTEPAVTAPPSAPDTASISPERAYTPLLPDLSKYDLTVGEALEVFPAEHRKRPSVRSLQRYCQEGQFDCFKLKTTRNGNPVHEWFINGTSLRKFIQTKPEEPAVAPEATPFGIGDADSIGETTISSEDVAIAIAPPEAVDDATDNPGLPRSPDAQPNVMATPGIADDAREAQTSRVELMVENAKLTARLESQEDLIGDLREDKTFMCEQIIHQRGNDTLMADMHRETLQTLKAVSVAGRHTKIEMPDVSQVGEPKPNFHGARASEHHPHSGRMDGV